MRALVLVVVALTACSNENADGSTRDGGAADTIALDSARSDVADRDASPHDATVDAATDDASDPPALDAATDAGDDVETELPDVSAPERDAAHDATGAPCSSDDDCADGRLCNGRERCDPVRGCLPSERRETCNDGDPCTSATRCDDATDSCVYGCNRFDPACDDEPICSDSCAIDDDCDDGRFCSGAEECVGGRCRRGAETVCDDGDPCTIELGCDREIDICLSECNDRNPECDCPDAG